MNIPPGSILTNKPNETQEVILEPLVNTNSFETSTLKDAEIDHVINSIKNGRAPGIDCIVATESLNESGNYGLQEVLRFN